MKTNRDKFIDIHCHCLPDIDDGPETLNESISLCRKLNDDWIGKVIATPHQLGRYGDYNKAERIREKVEFLKEELKEKGIKIDILPGGDVRVDERICKLIENDQVLTLADGGKYILLELPHEIFINIEPLINELTSNNITPIVSHPERHIYVARQQRILMKWLEQSAHLQITAGSLLGDFGSLAQKSAWEFLRMGWVSFVATDSHDTNARRPRMKNAYEIISAKLGREIAHLVCIENPLRILEGKDVKTAYSISTRKWIGEGIQSRY